MEQPIIPVKEASFQPMTKNVISKVEYTKIVQQQGGESITISTSNLESIFELPARVMNLSKSHLTFSASHAGHATKANFTWMSAPPIRQAQLYSRSGVMLCDINNLQNYVTAVNPFETKVNERMDSNNETDDDKYITYFPQSISGATAQKPDNGSFGDSTLEPVMIAAASDTNQTIVVNYNFPLSVIKNSILALDKSLYFNETILLKIIWGTRDEIGFTATAETNPNDGLAVLDADVTVSSLKLYLALERNPIVAAAVIEKTINEGNVINCPYVYVFKNVPGASTSQNVSIRFNRSNGTHLKKLYHTLYNNTETLNTRFNHANSVLTSYYTSVNNQRLQQSDLVVADEDDYRYMYHEGVKDSIVQNLKAFKFHWAHLDKFEDVATEDPNDNIVSGLPLDVEQKWDINCTTGAATAYNHYTFAITNRPLVISSGGIVFA
jgi:hypothetical protein